ncbi:hypothetical protein B0H66DRAFT_466016 [Apodospora peruviana]|uniref:JmjC domain-containing protein n=1 Tax=Apodospora peruviana TaxID=516989 RepID=A0AAE0ITZ2_9PEZI|nr:hypothetical protein B0H66DRAFT_466016 [Apodospora peruviana]
MDALQGKVDSVDSEVRQIAVELRGYIDHGITTTRKVKPPGTKAGRELLQHLLGRLDQMSSDLADARRLSSSIPQTLSITDTKAPDTPQSYDSPPPTSSQILQALQTQALQTHTLQTLPQDGLVQQTPNPHGDSTRHEHVAPSVEHTQTHQKPRNSQTSDSHRNGTHHEHDHRPSLISDGTRTRCETAYAGPVLSPDSAPLFDCSYRDMHILNEHLYEHFSSHPEVRDRGYFKLQVKDLPPLHVERMERPTKDHAQSFKYKADQHGLIKVDTGKKPKFTEPRLPFPMSTQLSWSLDEQRELWNSTARNPPKGHRPYIIGNPLFDDIELSPGEKLRQRGPTTLEGINTQYVYFNLTGKTITTMHREDAHVRSENLLRSGENKFWCFVKPSSTAKLEEAMHKAYPQMRHCSQAVRHLSLHIPPARLDEWGVEYTLDYCVPGQAIVTEPGTYHQVLNLGPNYAVAINLEYMSSPDSPPDYRFCDKNCPDKFAISAEDFQIYRWPTPPDEESPSKPEPLGSRPTPPCSSSGTVEAPFCQKVGAPPLQAPPNSNPQPSAASTGLTNGSVLSSERRFPYTSDQLLPEQMSEQHSLSSRQSSINTPPGGVASQVAPLPLQSQSPPRQANGYLPTEQLGSHFTHTLREFSLRPIQGNGNGQPEFRNENNTPGVANTMESMGPKQKRSLETPSAKRSQKKQKTGLAFSPETGLAPSHKHAQKSTLEHLATLVRGCGMVRKESLPIDQICSKPSFDRLAGLVRDYRHHIRLFPFTRGGMDLVRHADEMFQSSSALHVYITRLCKIKLAKWVENAATKNGRQDASNDYTDNLLTELGWDESQRPKLHDYLREGKCWKTICGKYDGLLCLMDPDIPDSKFTELALFQSTLSYFHSQLDIPFVWKLCEMGKALEKAIWGDLLLPEYIWEAVDTRNLSLNQVFPLLGRFRFIKKNQFDLERYFWSRPPGWNWNWPVDPTSLSPYDSQHCGQCNMTTITAARTPCRCFWDKVPDIQRVSEDGSKGCGIRAVGIYKSADMLGELVGEIVPLGTYSSMGDWTMEFRRPDLDHEPVAEIYPRAMGNWVRKVNHCSTMPSAVFQVMKISGRWRQMLIALRDIKDGEEITAKYGQGFMRGQPYSLVEGLY